MKPVKLSIEEVRGSFEELYSQKPISAIQKIRLKCWLYHSESRHRNGNHPFYFRDYIHALGLQTYLDYINFELIDCEDIGGAEKAKEVVTNYHA